MISFHSPEIPSIHKMYRYTGYVAALSVLAFTGSRSSAPLDFGHALASLLATKAKPSTADFDEILKAVIKTDDYQQLLASQADPDGLAVLLDDVRVLAPVADSGAGLRGSASASSADAASTGLRLPDVELVVSHEPVTSSGSAGRPMARLAVSAGDSALGGVPPTATLSVSSDPSTAQYQSTKYIITTIDTLGHIVTVLNAVEADVNAGNYLSVVTRVDEECNFLLSKLADDAISKIFTRDDTAAKWKNALKQVQIQMSTYVATKPGPETWLAFKAQMVAAITTLLDYAIVARTTMGSTPAPGTSNEELERQVQDKAIETGCLCIWKLFSCCYNSDSVKTAPPPSTAPDSGVVAPPSSATMKTLQLALFIDHTVATIQSIIDEVRTLEASGPEGERRLRNLQLRIELGIMTLTQEALANDALVKIYDALKGRSLFLLGTFRGVSSAGAWDSIKAAVTETLAAIVSDLNASKPGDVFAAPSGR